MLIRHKCTRSVLTKIWVLEQVGQQEGEVRWGRLGGGVVQGLAGPSSLEKSLAIGSEF